MNDEKRESQVKVRLSEDLKAWLKHQAAGNRRSLIREIEHRLAESRGRDTAGAAL